MICRYLGKEGACEGKYDGYACIKGQCPLFREAKNCEHHDLTGDYCRKYGRFGCVGRESCQSLADYLEAIAEEEQVGSSGS